METIAKKVCRNLKITLFNHKNYHLPDFCIVRNGKIASFQLPIRCFRYYPKKLYASYKTYSNGNISNTNIGLDVQINDKVCTHIGMWHGGYRVT